MRATVSEPSGSRTGGLPLSRSRHLAAVRVVHVQPDLAAAVSGQDGPEAPADQVGMDHVGGKLADADAGAYRLDLGLHIVEAGHRRDLPVHQVAVHVQFPWHHAPGGRAAEAGARVPHQFVERGRRAVPREVIRRRADDQRQVAQAPRHHVLARAGADAEADVDPGFDRVGEEVAQYHVEADAGMLFAEALDQRHQHAAAERRRRGQADQSVVFAAAGADLFERFVELAHARRGQFEQARAVLGQAELARGPVQQADAQIGLQRAHGLARRLRRDTGLDRGTPVAAGAHHAEEESEDPGLVHDWQPEEAGGGHHIAVRKTERSTHGPR